MRTLAIIQARSGSTRLPQKVLLEMPDGRPMLHWVIERARAMRKVDDVLVAVPYNDFLASECAREAGCAVSFGPPEKLPDGRNDVLRRYYLAAREYGLEERGLIVRITSDCPLYDPDCGDTVIGRALSVNGQVFCENTRPGVDGLDTEVFSMAMLQQAEKEAVLPDDRHHVGPWMRRQIGRLHVSYYETFETRLVVSVNTHADFARVIAIAKHLPPRSYNFADTLLAANKAGVLNAER